MTCEDARNGPASAHRLGVCQATFRCRPSALEPSSDLGNWNSLIDDKLSGPQTGAWDQSRVSVRHKRAFLTANTFTSPAQPARPSLTHTPGSQSLNQLARPVQLARRLPEVPAISPEPSRRPSS